MIKGNIGWVISLWIDALQIELNDRDGLPHLSWSPYDRVTIEEVEKFADFFETTEMETWNGTVQRLHLIPTEAEKWKPGNRCLIDVLECKESSYGIYCIITARYKNRFQDIEDIEDRICEKISKYVEEKEIQWQTFQSLGAEDFVGIFLANNIMDIASVGGMLSQLTYEEDNKKSSVFSSVYSFMGLNDPQFCQEPKADLKVRLFLKPGFSKKDVFENLKMELKKVFGENFSEKNVCEIMSGKGGLEVKIPNHANVLSCFHNNENAIFNGQSNFYKKYIEGSRTYWYVEEEKIESTDTCIGEVDVYREENIKNNICQIPNIHPISKFILKEYERLINSQRCLWWRPILKNQLEVYSQFVKEYTEDGNEKALCTLNNVVQTVLLHINQATTPIYEVPYHNYYYAGSYNDVLRMYYGVIASVFNIAYKLPRDSDTYQYEISYCVDFEAATEVHSTMYKLKNGTRRFVVFHLPYDAFMRFDKTIKLLLHEVFHYVAPYSRSNRNKILINILIINVFETYIKYLQQQGLTEENSKNIFECFFAEFQEICKNVEEELGDTIDKKILNDFTTENRIRKLKNISDKICEIICNWTCENGGIWIKEVRHCCSYEKVYPYLAGEQVSKYFSESIRRAALAAKEAFCDLNMIYILKLSLKEYIKLFLDMFLKKYSQKNVVMKLQELNKNKLLSVGSYELRIGLVLDQYYSKKLKNSEPEQYRDTFIEEINVIKTEEQDEVFRLFCEYLEKVYEGYLSIYRKEHSLHREFFSGERKWFELFLKDEDIYRRLRSAVSFHETIDEYCSVISDFMNEEIDEGLLSKGKKNKAVRKINNICQNWEKEIIVACDLGEYVKECCQMIQEWGDEVVWFRGLCSHKYNLAPSLFRNLDSELSLYSNQAKFLMDAYYITLSKPDLWNENMGNRFEHMCLLQHYGIPTSLLDFSDDMLVALHFALNPDDPDDVEKVNGYIHQPKVVLFNPFKYNEAIISLQKGQPMNKSKSISPFLLDVQAKEYYVDNLTEDYLQEHSEKYTKEYIPCGRTNLYPRPLVIRRGNERIQAQKGTFVAFNLFACPNKNSDRPYSYLELEKIQEEYFELLKQKNEPIENGEFIKEIYIDKLAVPVIKEQLKTMNVTTARTYPELFRVFSEYMDRRK